MHTQTFTQAIEAEKHHDAGEEEERDEEAGEASDPGASIILTPNLRFLRFLTYLRDLEVPELCREVLEKVTVNISGPCVLTVDVLEAKLECYRFKGAIGWKERIVLTKLLKVSDVYVCVCMCMS